MQAVRRTLAAASSAAALIAVTAPADAATVTTTPCVPVVAGLTSPTMPITGAGFTPGSLVTVRYASAASPTPSFLTTATADVAGNFSTLVNPPLFAKFDTQLQTFGLAATDSAVPPAGPITAGTTYEQVRVGYTTNPASGKPTRQATHTVRGFPTGKNTYLHFRYQGKTKRNVKLGKAKGVCGIVSKRMRLLPTTSRPGVWTVYADQKANYSKNTKPQLKYSFRITRTFG